MLVVREEVSFRMSGERLLEVTGLKMYHVIRKGLFGGKFYIKAVDNVDLTLDRGEALAIIGESGSGKTTLGKTILRLYEPLDGKIIFDGRDVTHIRRGELKKYRRETGFVQQDPYGALPPFMSIRQILEEPLKIHKIGTKEERLEKVYKALEEVRLTPVEDFINKYPHMLSGGQQQRVVIARSIITDPKLVIADEPVSMLDASVRVEILRLMESIQKKYKLGIIYISHDLSTTKYFSSRINIMYAGKLVEGGPTREVIYNPIHPYTRYLINALPDPDANNRFVKRDVPPGEPPSLINPPTGCRFYPRCPLFIKGLCDVKEPGYTYVNENHWVKCWYYEENR